MKRAVRLRLVGAVASVALISCAAPRPAATAAPAPVLDPAEDERARAVELDDLVRDVLDMLAAADPRVAAREGATASADALKRIGMDAIFAEDEGAKIREGSLDLFAFQARSRVLEVAAARVKAFAGRAPEHAAAGSPIEHPRLEYERLSRLVDEERARAAEEAKLGDAAGDLVRAMIATWTPPPTPEDGAERDAWVTAHVRGIRDSLRGLPRTSPAGLDLALNPLERILRPSEYPKSAAAIAELRVALDEDMRPFPALMAPERVAAPVKAYLGVAVDPATLATRLEPSVARIHDLAVAALEAHPDTRKATEARARELLFVEGKCPVGPGTRVGTIAPPPERALSCGIVRALAEEPMPGAALVALHDEALLALAAVTTSPPPRTRMLCHPEDDAVDAARREARERPVRFIAVLLAAEMLFAPGVDTDARLAKWRALGDAPLDVVTREVAAP